MPKQATLSLHNRTKIKSSIFNIQFYFLIPEGRKKTKDAKVSGKKKRAASEDEEKVEEKASTTQHKSNKKQKVNQEKEGRKTQKVIHRTHYSFIVIYFNGFLTLFDSSSFCTNIICTL